MDLEKIAKIARALGDPTRLQIFNAIAGKKEMSCSDVLSLQDVTPATISHHLKILSEAGLIECRRQGQFVYSCANPDTLRDYTRSLARLSPRAKERSRAAR